MNDDQKSQSTGTVVVASVLALIFGVLIGIGGYVLINNSSNKTPAVSSASDITVARQEARLDPQTPAANLRILLNSLEKAHVDLASNATRRGFDGTMDFSASADALDKNSVALSNAVGSVYGKDAGNKFLEIWRSHITFFVNYTVAAKKGDKVGMDKAVQDLGGYVDAVSDFFSQANPNLPREAVKQLVTEHVNLLKGAVDAYASKDYAGSYQKESDASDQIGKIADTITGAIVKQKPDSFK